MTRFIFPLFLIALGVCGVVKHNAINAQWDAMYPEEATLQNALTRCAQEDSLFNRFTASGRAVCYQKYLQVELPPPAPAVSVGIPGMPQHAVPHAPPIRSNSPQR